MQDISPLHTVTNIFFLLSLVCLILQALIWQQALLHYKLSYAFPFMSLVNFVVLFLSAILFDESITVYNILGLIIISIGIITISQDKGEEV